MIDYIIVHLPFLLGFGPFYQFLFSFVLTCLTAALPCNNRRLEIVSPSPEEPDLRPEITKIIHL